MSWNVIQVLVAASVHVPRIGARGAQEKNEWYSVERLLRKYATSYDVPFYVYATSNLALSVHQTAFINNSVAKLFGCSLKSCETIVSCTKTCGRYVTLRLCFYRFGYCLTG